MSQREALAIAQRLAEGRCEVSAYRDGPYRGVRLHTGDASVIDEVGAAIRREISGSTYHRNECRAVVYLPRPGREMGYQWG